MADTAERTTPWAQVGQETSAVTAKQALIEAGLDWDVTLEPIYVAPGDDIKKAKLIGPRKAVVRGDDETVLGVVSGNYRPVQNADAFSFFDTVIDSGDVEYDTVGSLRHGRTVWLTAKVPEDILINGDDPLGIYLLLRNSHDGSSSITLALTPVRVWCQNTLNLALRTAKSTWSVRHVSGLEERVAEAREALDMTFKYVAEFEDFANDLAQTKMSDGEFKKFVEKFTKELELGDRVVEEVQERTRALFNESPNLENVRGTQWAALNAIGEYYDWERPRNDRSRLINTWYGTSKAHRNVAARLLRR